MISPHANLQHANHDDRHFPWHPLSLYAISNSALFQSARYSTSELHTMSQFPSHCHMLNWSYVQRSNFKPSRKLNPDYRHKLGVYEATVPSRFQIRHMPFLLSPIFSKQDRPVLAASATVTDFIIVRSCSCCKPTQALSITSTRIHSNPLAGVCTSCLPM